MKPSLHVDDFLANVGGPVIRNKVFFFAAYEHLKRANPTADTITAANKTALINAGVSASDFLTAPTVQRAQRVDGRIDWSVQKNQLFVRYNYFRNNYPFNSNIGGLYAVSVASDFQDRAHDIAAQLVTTVSPTVPNEFRGSWPYRNEHYVADALTGPGPMVTINGIANFGGSNAVGDKYQEKIPSFNDNVTWILGRHSMKFGVGFQKNNDTQLADVYTQFTFASIAQYINAKNGTTPAGTSAYSSVTASIVQVSQQLAKNDALTIGYIMTNGRNMQFLRNMNLIPSGTLQVNSYGAIAAVDYLTESCSALSVSMVSLGRFTQDLLLWSTAEFNYLRLSDAYVQISNIMPQKRNPVHLEHVRILASRAFTQAQSILGCLHNTTFADMNDAEDDLQPLVYTAFNDALRSLTC